MRRLALALALCALAVPALAQQQDVQIGTLAYRYDLDSTTKTYCRLEGQRNDVFSSPKDGNANLATSGSSTTVTAVSGTPFSVADVGDVLISYQPDGVRETVIITAKTDATEVTVDTAVDWENGGSGYPFGWYDLKCGTTAEDGWVATPPGEHASVLLAVQYDAGDLTGGLDVSWECRGSNLGAAPIQVYPGGSSDCGGFASLSTDVCTLATAGTITSRLAYQIEPIAFEQCRVGLKANTSDTDGTVEEITVTVTAIR